MPQQAIRRANLIALAARLRAEGVTDVGTLACLFGHVVTAGKLQAMLEDGPIQQMACEAIAHNIGQPKHWLDVDRREEISTMEVDLSYLESAVHVTCKGQQAPY